MANERAKTAGFKPIRKRLNGRQTAEEPQKTNLRFSSDEDGANAKTTLSRPIFSPGVIFFRKSSARFWTMLADRGSAATPLAAVAAKKRIANPLMPVALFMSSVSRCRDERSFVFIGE
jgi:hypothetical protein